MRIAKLEWLGLLAVIWPTVSPAGDLFPPAERARQQSSIQATIVVFQSGGPGNIAKRIHYPLSRYYPLPSVKTPEDLVNRYHEIFDEPLLRKITASNAAKDWEDVGWRGFMLDNGVVWSDFDGLISAINHESKAERAHRLTLIETDRNALHRSLRVFDEPVLKWDTAHHQLRIDAQGEHYRLALWKAGASFLSKPQLTITQGVRAFQGSGGNHTYSFQFGELVYVCDVEVIGYGNEHGIGSLMIMKNENTLLHEEAIREY